MDPTGRVDQEAATPPFLLKLFYRTGTFHRPDEFASSGLPPYLPIYTYPSCTLNELTLHIAGADDTVLPSPAIGTRLAFRLIYPESRSAGAARFAAKDLGSVVIGDGGPGAVVNEDASTGGPGWAVDGDGGHRSLGDSRFVIGDYISCAILPPLASGAVAPASSANMGRDFGVGEHRAGIGAPGMRMEREGEAAFSRTRGSRPGFGGLAPRDGANVIPVGEWKRGERLPDAPGRGRGRGRGRW